MTVVEGGRFPFPVRFPFGFPFRFPFRFSMIEKKRGVLHVSSVYELHCETMKNKLGYYSIILPPGKWRSTFFLILLK